MRIKQREYILDVQSGKVYYTEDKQLKVINSLEEYNKMVDEEKRIANLYFEINIDCVYMKIQLCKHKQIMWELGKIEDFDLRMVEQLRYFTMKEEAGL